jgi:two-component system response regulator YesN
MNLMIVEDEARLRQSLAGSIPWEEHGIEVVGLAASGAEALRLFDLKKPDLLLLDVQMPEMDGLTLVRALREKDAHLKTVILSGHDNFAYAQQALEFGVSKYLLKPAGERDILEAVLEAAGRLRRELDRRYGEERLRQRWDEHLPRLREAFCSRLLQGYFAPGEAERLAADYGLKCHSGGRYAVAVVDAEPQRGAADEGAPASGGSARARFSAYLLARSLLAREDCWICLDGQGYVSLVFALRPEADPNAELLRAHAALDRLLSRTREGLGIVCSAGISGTAEGLHGLAALYRQACRALQERIVYGTGIAIPYREPETQAGPAVPAAGAELEKALEAALETGDAESARRAVSQIWDETLDKAGTADEMHEGILSVSSLLVRFIQNQGLGAREVLREHFPYFQNVKLLTAKEQLRNWLEGSAEAIAEFQHRRRGEKRHHFVAALLDIAREELDREVTLHTAAERLYVNPSYLSRLFKQEMGRTFSDYVLELKMEKAKRLLTEGAKVYDAARMVGYRDVSYFTKVFRKYWGATPGEIRQGGRQAAGSGDGGPPGRT